MKKTSPGGAPLLHPASAPPIQQTQQPVISAKKAKSTSIKRTSSQNWPAANSSRGGYTKPAVNLDNLLGFDEGDNRPQQKTVEELPKIVSGISVPYEVKKFGGSLRDIKRKHMLFNYNQLY